MSEPAGTENKNFETNLLAYEAKPRDENNQMAVHVWILCECEYFVYPRIFW